MVISVAGLHDQRLWRAVLARVVRDVLEVGCKREDRIEAERWIGAYPSSDFRQVCELSGYDHRLTFAVLKSICEMPVASRAERFGIPRSPSLGIPRPNSFNDVYRNKGVKYG